MLQSAVHRLQKGIQRLGTTFAMQTLKRFERHRLRQVERTGLGTPQFSDMRAAAKLLA